VHEIGSMIYNRATLPFERRKLDRLAVKSHRAIGPLPQMSPGAAATPTAQGD
jgi:hypothetical protein